MSAIYKFYEAGIKKVESDGAVSKNYTYVCIFCKEKDFKNKGNFLVHIYALLKPN